MKKMKAVAEGFDTCNDIAFEPFWRHGKIGAVKKYGGDVVLEPKFSYLKPVKFGGWLYFIGQEDDKYQIYSGTSCGGSVFELADNNEYDFIEAVEVNEELYFKTTMANGRGLCRAAGLGLDILVPNEYAKVEVNNGESKLFKAYPSVELEHFDLYGRDYFEPSILIAKNVREYAWEKGYVVVTFVDNEQALYGQGFVCVIEKGKHQIKPENGFIRVIEDGNVAIHTWSGYKVSEDDSGKWQRFGEFLVHITDKERTFYRSEGEKLDLNQFEDVREESEFIFVKSNGHWRLLWTV